MLLVSLHFFRPYSAVDNYSPSNLANRNLNLIRLKDPESHFDSLMERTQLEIPQGIRPVKAAISFHGERIHGRKPDKHRNLIPITETTRLKDSRSRTRELRRERLDVGRLNDRKKFAEKEKASAESELYTARSAAEELSQRVEDSNTKTRAHRLTTPERSKDGVMNPDMLRELHIAKEEVSRLKHDMSSASEAKTKAEKEIEAYDSRAKSYVSILRKEIEEANEEHVLVELARIEAERELREIEARRGSEATQFSKNMDVARKKIANLGMEINRAKELEVKLAAINSDVDVLQNEMELVRSMDRNSKKNDDSNTRTLIQSAEAELMASKKEVESVKAEGFQFMASMDRVRKELIHIAKEMERLKKLEKKADSTVQILNSKLLKAKSKLESATSADEREKKIVSNLSSALQQLRAEIAAANKEKEAVCEESRSIKLEMEKTDAHIKSAEEGLQTAMQELEAVKASEAVVINQLRRAREGIIESRCPASIRGSTVIISKSEYDYLTSRAVAAQVVADKKVAAAQAWIEALKAGEKEILMKTEFIQREIKELRIVEEKETCKTEKALVAQRAVEEELRSYWRRNEDAEASDLLLVMRTPRKSIKDNGIPAAARSGKMKKLSSSPGTRYNPRSPSITIKKRTKLMPSVVNVLRNRSMGKHK